MKKYAMLALALAIPLTLSACGKDKPDSLDDRLNNISSEEGVVLSYEGTIESIDLSIYQQGTHQIDTGSGMVLIQSANFNLDNYLGKKVEVRGTLAPALGNAEDVLNVNELELLEADFSERLDYESQTNNFSLKYPANWELEKLTNQLNFIFNQKTIGSLIIFDNITDPKSFAEDREGHGGTRITAASQASLRYNDADSFRVYIPQQTRLFLVRFDQENFQEASRREAVYDLIKSIEFTYHSKATDGPTCGGPENIPCPEGSGYVCQLEAFIPVSPEEEVPETDIESESEAEMEGGNDTEEGQTPEPATEVAQIPFGVCIPKDAGKCPELSPPSCEGAEAYVSQYSELGCPSMFSCPSPDQSSLELNQDELIEGLIEGQIQEEESEETPDGLDDSEEETNGGEEETSVSEIEERDYAIPALSSIDTTVEVSQRNFSFNRPSAWYYSGLSNTDGTQWRIGLSDEQFWKDEEEDDDSTLDADKVIITISIIDKDKEGPSSGYTATKSRDETTEYRVQGPSDSELKKVIDAIADSIETTESSD